MVYQVSRITLSIYSDSMISPNAPVDISSAILSDPFSDGRYSVSARTLDLYAEILRVAS